MQSGFEEIYHQYKNKVYNLVLSYVRNREEAEEVTQDVFISVHQSIEKFEQRSSLSTWIYRITINKSLDAIKAAKRKKRWAIVTRIFQSGPSLLDSHHSTFDHPGVQLEQKEILSAIFNCMDELPDQQRTALILSKIEHKSQLEISEIMGISTKAVESLVQRAKTNLTKKLKDIEGNEK
jgi:RNA polymerase sigma factor (sigma-70 family)